MENLSREEFERDLKLRDTNWFYTGTTRIWGSFLRSIITDINSLRAIDLGCGTGGKAIYLKKFSRKVYGLDLSMDALEFCKGEAEIPLTQASIERIPFKNTSFSIVNAFDVLEHVEDDISVLKEIRRIMTDKGSLVITVPAFMSLWSQHDVANFHKRRYSAEELTQKLEKAGFKVKRISYINCFLFPFVLAVRIVQRYFARSSSENKRTRVEDIPGFLNNILSGILYFEANLIRKVNFPFGVAIVCVAQKTQAGSGVIKATL